MKFTSSSSLLALPAMASAFCHHGTSLWARSEDAHEATFGYEGETGPMAWASLDEANSACAHGKQQSPANLVLGDKITQFSGGDIRLELPNLDHGAELVNLGTTLEVIMEDKGASIEYNGVNATLKQFHFHTPSEHHINGEYFPMEVHFVFDAGESLVVLGIPIEMDWSDETIIGATFRHVDGVAAPGSEGETGSLYFHSLLSHVRRSQIWTYGGSLTTPPCSEVVTWMVVDKPIKVSATTYKKVKKILGYNARYTQNAPGEVNLLEHANEVIFS